MYEQAEVAVHAPQYSVRVCIVEIGYLLLHPFNRLVGLVSAPCLDECSEKNNSVMYLRDFQLAHVQVET